MQENAVAGENSGGRRMGKRRKELSSRQSTQLTRNSYTERQTTGSEGGKWAENREIQGVRRGAAN